MYDVVAMFPKKLSKNDIISVKTLTEARKCTRIRMDLSYTIDFCRIGLGVKMTEEVDAFKIIKCQTLTTLMMSPWCPFFCVRLDSEVLKEISHIGSHLSMAEHVFRPLLVALGSAQQAQSVRKYLNLAEDRRAIELIENQLAPVFQSHLAELIEACRAFYKEKQHIEE